MTRRLHLLVLCLCACICIGAGPAGAWYPASTQVELGTTTWCTYCPDAYAGIEVCQGLYGPHEFNAIRYYGSDSGGGLANAETDARNTYYGISAFPTAYFNGQTSVEGGGEDVASGATFRAIIESHLDDPSYFKITINSFDLSAPDGSIDCDIEVMEDVPDISMMNVRIAITEDNVDYAPHTHMDVTRDMLPDIPVTVNTTGQVQNVNEVFAVDAGWVEENLKIVLFVQDDTDKVVWASDDTRPTPDYATRYFALGDRQAVGPAFVAQIFDWFEVHNVGSLADSVFIEVESEGAAGWINVLCSEEYCIGPLVEEWLEPGEFLRLHLQTIATTTGWNSIKVNITQKSAGRTYARSIEYTYITDDVTILVVDDDGAQEYEEYFQAALDYTGLTYGVWNRNLGVADAATLANFDQVIWNVGWSFPTLDEDDRTALMNFLDNGGGLFVTGQDIGWEMNDIGGAAYDFYQDYLHADFVNDDTNDYDLDGVDQDPISHLLPLMIIGGDGANNQQYQSDIDPADGTASVIWTYDENRNGAIKADTGTHRVVYFAFGFEAIDNAYDRAMVMHRIMNWLRFGTVDVEEGEQTFRATLGVYPNPVQTTGQIRFTMPATGQASLKVFGPDGRVVRTLAQGELEAGPHVVDWNGTAGDGSRLPAGIYYYRFENNVQTLTKKAVLLK